MGRIFISDRFPGAADTRSQIASLLWRCQNELKSLSACLRHLARRAFQMGEQEDAGVFAKLPSSLPPPAGQLGKYSVY